MIELNKIYNEDCLTGMQRIPDGSVDAIICDLPYGTMKGIGKGTDFMTDKFEWDVIIPTEKLFEQYERVLRKGGVAVLFSQEPYTSHLRTFKAKNLYFCQPCIWLKNTSGNHLKAKNCLLNFFEDINIFTKRYDSELNNTLRNYFENIIKYLGSKKSIIEKIGQKADHTFRYNSSQFELCTEETYKDIIEKLHIDKIKGFRTYEDLKKENENYKRKFSKTFNLPDGYLSLSNVFKFSKDADSFHPTQKPVDLIRKLIITFSNEGDTILDNCMGSGTTAIACIKEKRNFIGFETNKEYYEKSLKRIQAERQQLTLF